MLYPFQFLSADVETRAIFSYIEGVSSGQKFLATIPDVTKSGLYSEFNVNSRVIKKEMHDGMVHEIAEIYYQNEDLDKLYIKFHNTVGAEIAELGKGDGFRVHFRRDSWVQIPLSA